VNEAPTHKMVDGVRVELTEEEKAAIIAEWESWEASREVEVNLDAEEPLP